MESFPFEAGIFPGATENCESRPAPYYANPGPNFYQPYEPEMPPFQATPDMLGLPAPVRAESGDEHQRVRYDDLLMTDFQLRSGLRAVSETPSGSPPPALVWPLPDVNAPTLCSLLGLGSRTGLESLLEADESSFD